ncbi:MAG: N-acetylmuramoyl-L-alanine amidase [Oscillospiraceae bacterium]|jgi:N-acetylmuramoyl-L-alanine amidase|nr:N-acetylmuramoyl-L-alanine amidase [Oscillospiraceae bacterium]
MFIFRTIHWGRAVRKRWLHMVAVFAGLALATAGAVFWAGHSSVSTLAPDTVPTAPVILLDAGHGGEDGGAVAIDGTAEKEFNLPITLKLSAFLRALGYQVQLTRTEDKATYSSGCKTLREKKVSDIHNRFAMMEALPPTGLFMSIHQNHYVGEKYHGAQVFYSKNDPQSAVLAQAIQESVVAMLQPDNTRQIKPSGTEIYLLYEATRPAVLVECGFLSNTAETKLLHQDAYQNQMAFAIACGLANYSAIPAAGVARQ